MSGQASSELRRGEEKRGRGKISWGMGSVPGCLFASAWRWFREGLLADLVFLLSLASCLLLLVSSSGSLVRLNTSSVCLLSLMLLRSLSFLATRLVSSLTFPPFFFLSSLPPLPAYCRSRLRTSFLTCILSAFEMHTRLPPPFASPALSTGAISRELRAGVFYQ